MVTSRVHFRYQGGEERLGTLALGISTLGNLKVANYEELYQKLEQINKSMEGIYQHGVGPTMDTQLAHGIHLKKTLVLYGKAPVVQRKTVRLKKPSYGQN